MGNKFIIDAPTSSGKVIKRRLGNLKTTLTLDYRGPYTQAPEACQIYVETTWTEDELDLWLWKSKGIDYIGVADAEA